MATRSKQRGRPKGDPYTTLLARVPAELADCVKAYAIRHQQSISELIRDGLVWRLDEGDPHQQRYRTELATAPLHPGLTLVLDEDDDTTPVPSVEADIDEIHHIYDVIQKIEQASAERNTNNTENTVTVIQDKDMAAEGMLATDNISVIQNNNIVLHETKTLDQTRVLQSRPTHMRTPPAGIAEADALEDRPLVPAGENRPQHPAPDYDHTRYRPGPLCKHGHAYGDTDQSLREIRPNRGGIGDCTECHRERARASIARLRAK
jgi:hypothetical protein